MMTLFVKTLRGETFAVQIKSTNTVLQLKLKLQPLMHKAPDQLRIIFEGKQLEDPRTLQEYDIIPQSTLHVVERLAGDIGVFEVHSETFRREFLTSQSISTIQEDINSLVSTLGGDPLSKFHVVQPAIQPESIDALIEFSDIKHKMAMQANEEEADDLKIYFERKLIVDIFGEQNFKLLEEYFGDNYSEIILRRCESHGMMINFHTDVSLKTLQLSLNDDSQYEGGKLIYATHGKLDAPKRHKGTVTVHDNKIVHGVTRLTSGVRYGLFLLKK